MGTMMRRVGAVAWALLVLSTIEGTLLGRAVCQDPVRLEVYPVRDLTFAMFYFTPPKLGLLWVDGSEQDDMPRSSGASEDPVAVLENERLKSMLVELTGSAYWADTESGASIEPNSGLLIVRCDEAMHSKLRAVLAMMREFQQDMATIEFYELPTKSIEGDRSILSAADCSLLLRGVGVKCVGRKSMIARNRANISMMQGRSYVAGLKFAAVPGRVMPDPQFGSVQTGRVWDVAIWPASDDRMVLSLNATMRLPLGSMKEDCVSEDIKKRGEIIAGEPSKAATIPMELPAVRTTNLTASAWLRSGEGLILCAGETATCVRLHFREPRPRLRSGSLRAYEVGDLVTGLSNQPGPNLRLDSAVFVPPDEDPQPALCDLVGLQELIKATVLPGRWDGAPNTLSGDEKGPLFVNLVEDREADWKAIEDLLAKLSREAARQWTIEYRYGVVPASKAVEYAQGRDPAELADELGAGRGGRCLGVAKDNVRQHTMCIEQRVCIVDYDAAIAAETSAAEPRLGSSVTGFVFDHRGASDGDRHVVMDLRITFLEATKAVPSVDLSKGDARFGQLHLTELGRSASNTTLRVEVGKWTLVHVTPMTDGSPQPAAGAAGDSPHFVVVMRLSPLP